MRIPAGLVVASLLASGLPAATLEGVIVDSTGALIAGARVELGSPGQTPVRTAFSGTQGEFAFPEVVPGSYTLRVQARDFAEETLPVHVTPQDQEVRVELSQIAPVYANITVTASRGSAEETESAAQVATSVARDDGASRPLQTAAHALDGSAGVVIQETTQGQSSPLLRGLTGYQTLLLVDGIRFNTCMFRSGPNQYFSFIQPSQVDRIEAVLGPAGASFGSDAMGGTINVLTAQPNLGGEAGHRSWQGAINTYGASAALAAGWDARLSGIIGRFTYLLGGSTQHENDLRTGGGGDSRNSFFRYFGLDRNQIHGLLGDRLPGTGSSREGAEAKAMWQISSSQSVSAWYQHSGLGGLRSYRDQLGGPGRLLSKIEPQGLNFGYVRYEKLGLGPLDSLSGTLSVNSQQDGTVQQAFRFTDPITTNSYRVDSLGYTVQSSAHAGSRQALVFGSETFQERVYADRFIFDPVQDTTVQARAQYPNGSHYTTSSLFLQDSAEFVPHRLRATAGLRYTMVRFAAFANSNRDSAGRLLGVVDSSRSFSDVTFNSSASWQVSQHLTWHVLVGRGFRAPNLNDLGAIGLTTLGYDIPAEEIAPLHAQFGLDSSDGSASSGKYVASLKPESLFNYETGWTLQADRFYGRAQVFDTELLNPISGRTVLFPAGAAPTSIAGVAVTPIPQSAAQQSQGVVAVATSQSPRAVMAEVNDGHTKYYGTELLLRLRLTNRWSVQANYSFLAGRDLNPNRPVRRLPPQQGMMTLRYVPSGRRLWLELTARAAGPQERLNGGDIDDDRIGASRRRSDIATFFSGGFVSPYLLPGADGRLGTADDVFGPTGETLKQIQNRVLPIGAKINGVTVLNDSTRVPLYIRNGGWFALDVRGGAPLYKTLHLTFAITNLLDRNYRVYGSGVDAPGLSAFLGFKYAF